MVYQIWKCRDCKHHRVWGASHVEDDAPESAWLECEGSCKKKDGSPRVTQHVFLHHRSWGVEKIPKKPQFDPPPTAAA